MRKKVVLLATVSVALLVLSLYLLYCVIDQAVSLDHARAEQRSLQEDRAILRKLIPDLLKTSNRSEVESLLDTRYAQSHIVKREGDTIFVDGVGLRFQGDQLVGIVFMSEIPD